MKKNNLKIIKKPVLKEEDGQLKKIEESKVIYRNNKKPLFWKDVNDPSERGYD
tara:strand:- start:587 stop:745 length:159 start_codon:yes stop_codon:yes gene_type:complete